jgi:hypothetical protein
MDMSGRAVFEQDIKVNNSEEQFELSLGDSVPPGLYQLAIRTQAGEMFFAKLVKI